MCPSLHMSFVQYHELQYKVWFLKDKNRKRPFVIVDYLKTCDCCCCCFSYTDISVHFFSEFFRFLAHIQSLAAGRFNWKCELSVAKIIWESLKARRFFKPQMYDFAQEKGKCLSRSASQPGQDHWFDLREEFFRSNWGLTYCRLDSSFYPWCWSIFQVAWLVINLKKKQTENEAKNKEHSNSEVYSKP